MAKPINHKEGASAIAALKFLALVCLILGMGTALLMIPLSDGDAASYVVAGALAFSGIFNWVLLSVVAYMAQCLGRLAIRADSPSKGR